MSDSPQPKQHGGARPGAGRPPTGVVALHCYPQGSTVKRVRAVARATKRTLGQVIDAACLHAMPQVEPTTPPLALSVEPLGEDQD